MKLPRLVLPALLLSLVPFGISGADEIVSFGDVTLAPGTTSGSLDANVFQDLLGIDVAFIYPGSSDGSWSSDYYAIITDPSGDSISLGTGLGIGQIAYPDGTPSGVDGSQADNDFVGDYGTFFSIADIQAITPTFGEAGETGVYTVVFRDGWTGGVNSETLGSATVTLVTAVPEPAAGLVLTTLTGIALLRRRR